MLRALLADLVGGNRQPSAQRHGMAQHHISLRCRFAPIYSAHSPYARAELAAPAYTGRQPGAGGPVR